MAAFLRHFLIFKLNACHAGGFIAKRGVAHIQKTTIARIGIRDQRRFAPARHGAHACDQIRIGGNARFCDTKGRGNCTKARAVDAVKPHAIGDLGRDHVKDTGGEDEALFGKRLPKRWVGHRISFVAY